MTPSIDHLTQLLTHFFKNKCLAIASRNRILSNSQSRSSPSVAEAAVANVNQRRREHAIGWRRRWNGLAPAQVRRRIAVTTQLMKTTMTDKILHLTAVITATGQQIFVRDCIRFAQGLQIAPFSNYRQRVLSRNFCRHKQANYRLVELLTI